MLDRLRDFFAADPNPGSADPEAALHLAAAVLLVEVAKVDHSLEALELARMCEVLQRNWALDQTDLDDLLAVARDTSDIEASLHRHTDQINQAFSVPQKIDLLRGFWEVALADGELHPHEELLIRRLADLIYVPHKDFIRAKHLAQRSQAGR